MNDCPDCENKVTEEKETTVCECKENGEIKTACDCGCEEHKDDACNCGCEEHKEDACNCGCEEHKEDAKAGKPLAKKILFSLARIVGLTVVVAVILFFVAKPQIMRVWYTERDNGKVKAMITEEINKGLAGTGATATITYFDEGKEKENGYKIVVTDKNGKQVGDEFRMFAKYNEANGVLTINFADEIKDHKDPRKTTGIEWKSIQMQLKRAKTAPAAEEAAPAAEEAAPAAEEAAPAAK